METDLQNKLKKNEQQIFSQLIGCQMNFKMPGQQVHPFALHMIDGDLLLLWASSNSLPKWIQAFKSLIVGPRLAFGRQQIFIQLQPQNSFTVAIFRSLETQTMITDDE